MRGQKDTSLAYLCFIQNTNLAFSLVIVDHSKLDCQQTAKASNLIYDNGIKSTSEEPQPECSSPAEGAVRLKATESCHYSHLLPAVDVQDEWGRMTTVVLAAMLTELINTAFSFSSITLEPSPSQNALKWTCFTPQQVWCVSVLIKRKEGKDLVMGKLLNSKSQGLVRLSFLPPKRDFIHFQPQGHSHVS